MGLPKILIVDDSITACLFMANVLQQAGYEVSIAIDGYNVLAKVLAQRPQCLILDVILPGINGYTVCRQVRAADPQHTVPIILISTKNTPLDRSYGLSQGADRYLSKPFTAETLLQAVWDVLPSHLRPPAALHHGRASPQRLAGQELLLALQKLIPHRSEDPDLLRLSNPLDGSVVISDKQARRLYAAIDGRKTVDELCSITHLNMKEVHRALQILLAQHRIQLYTTDGKPVDSSLLLNEQ